MKVEQIEPKPSFKPVVITLESQEEVDALYGAFNYSPLWSILRPAFSQDPHELLGKYQSGGADGRVANRYWEQITNAITRKI